MATAVAQPDARPRGRRGAAPVSRTTLVARRRPDRDIAQPRCYSLSPRQGPTDDWISRAPRTATDRPQRAAPGPAAERSGDVPREPADHGAASSTSPTRSTPTRSSSSRARPARARRRSCRRSASRWAAAATGTSAARSRGASRPPASRRASPRSSTSQLGEVVGYKVRFNDRVKTDLVREVHDRRHPARRDPGRPDAARATTRSSSTRPTSAASTSTSSSAS